MKTERTPYRDYEIELKEPIPGQWQAHSYPTRLGLPLMPGSVRAVISPDREMAIAEAKARVDDLLGS